MLKKLLRSVSIMLTPALVFSILACAPFSVSAAQTDAPADTGADYDLAETSAEPYNPFGELSAGKYTLTSTTYQLTDDSSDETLINTVTALYRYHEAAVDYFSRYTG